MMDYIFPKNTRSGTKNFLSADTTVRTFFEIKKLSRKVTGGDVPAAIRMHHSIAHIPHQSNLATTYVRLTRCL